MLPANQRLGGDDLLGCKLNLRLEHQNELSVVNRLAQLVHAEVVDGIGGRYRDMPDLGVKTGPFYVLFLSSIPSILVETGFLTNKHDVALLRKRDFLEQTADHIAAGLVSYRRSRPQVAAGGSP